MSQILPRDLVVSIQSWMFLNTIQADYIPDSLQANIERQQNLVQTEDVEYQTDEPSPCRYISPFHLGEAEGYLWSYFNEYMTAQIVIDPGFNPYRDIVLKMAAFSREGPLFQCVLAASANQLQSIGRNEYKQAMWLHRAKALRLLRAELTHLASREAYGGVNGTSKDQIIASTIMLTFFEVSE